MRRSVLALVFVFLPNLAHAEVIQMPIPELQGQYEPSVMYQRSVKIKLSQPVTIVNGVSMTVRGVANPGQIHCSGVTYPWTITLVSTVSDTSTNDEWGVGHGTPEESVPFEFTVNFGPLGADDPSWDFLIGGRGELSISLTPTYIIGICSFGREPEVNITDVVLFVDGEVPIPILPTSWGLVKALYGD